MKFRVWATATLATLTVLTVVPSGLKCPLLATTAIPHRRRLLVGTDTIAMVDGVDLGPLRGILIVLVGVPFVLTVRAIALGATTKLVQVEVTLRLLKLRLPTLLLVAMCKFTAVPRTWKMTPTVMKIQRVMM